MAERTIDPVDAAIGNIESQGNYGAVNPQSSARGKYQFMPETFMGVQRNNPDLPKMSFEEFQKNPDAQEQYQKALRDENTTFLTKRGLDATPANLYMLHFFGAPKGTSLLKAEENEPITDYLSQQILQKNKLNPKMTVGELRSKVGGQMDKALGTPGAGQQPYRVDVVGVGQGPEELPANAGQGLTPPKSPFGYTEQHKKEMDSVSESLAKVQKYAPNSPEYNMAVADAVKKSSGPNWTNAFLAALFGQKEQSLMWITGGRNKEPKIAEAYIDGRLQRVNINSNERGDQWYTDPATGARLPDNIQITSTSPEGALQTGRIRAGEEAGVNVPLGIENRKMSNAQLSELQTEEKRVTAWTQAQPGNYGLLEDIQTGTKKFAPALNNILRGPEGSAFLDAWKAFTGGKTDIAALQSAAVKAGIQPEDMGSFVQYMRSIDTINKRDAQLKDAHAPGSGTSGELTLEGGAEGIEKWLQKRVANHAMQSAWNDYFLKNKQAVGSAASLVSKFMQSPEYAGVQNFERYQKDRKNAKIEDGAPIANYDRNGNLVMQKWNATKKRGE